MHSPKGFIHNPKLHTTLRFGKFHLLLSVVVSSLLLLLSLELSLSLSLSLLLLLLLLFKSFSVSDWLKSFR